ncbi:MAG: hypothetical protein NZM04_01565, partial [Methylacidiphilales bacterium]|nr:hypothetical protein [Candidatus Methylacidiphilales bacterium]
MKPNPSPTCSPSHPSSHRSFALIITLLIITLLTFTTIAFFTAAQVERTNSRAAYHLTQAQLTAQAGVQVAQQTLRHLITQFPDSITKFEPRLANQEQFPGTALLYKKVPPTDPQSHSTPYTYLPLVSGAVPTPLNSPADRLKAIPSNLLTDSIDLNHPSLNPDRTPFASGWITGLLQLPKLSPDYTSNQIRAPWVYISDPQNPAKKIARYAYWIEDESFKINLNYAAAPQKNPNQPRPLTGEPARYYAKDPLNKQKDNNNHIIANGIPLISIDYLNSPQSGLSLTLSTDKFSTEFNEIRSNPKLSGPQNTFRSLEEALYTLGAAKNLSPEATYRDLAQLKFLTTTTSSALNISRAGIPRLDLNDMINQGAVQKVNHNKEKLAATITRIIHAINYNTTARPTPAEAFNHPYFWGRRLTTNSPVPYNDALRPLAIGYLKRLAINIHDHIHGYNNPPTYVYADNGTFYQN